MSRLNLKKGGFVAFGALVIIAAGLVLLPRFQSEELTLPKNLGVLTKTEEVRGERASKIINQMHGKGVTPADNVIGIYTSSNGTATVYLSGYSTHKQSEETFQQMVRGIERGTSPFSEFEMVTISGQDIAFCVGFGQAHYFFSIDESVYWLTADFAVAEEAANELMRALKGSSTAV